MSRSRLYIARPVTDDQPLTLDAEQAHYLGRVLRMKPGDSLAVFDGSGNEWPATVAELRKSTARLDVGQALPIDNESPLPVRLVQGVARGERMDIVVQKATELGVTEIQPVVTEHAVVRFRGDRAERRAEHWRKVAISACEQSGRTRLPRIHEPLDFPDYLAGEPGAALRLCFAPDSESGLGNLERPADGRIELLVGPEGGLSPGEIEAALASGFTACRLGPRVLRSETAGIAALTLVQGLWGDLG